MSSGELNNKFIYDVIGRITTIGLQNSSTHWIPSNCVLIGLAGQGKTRRTAAINFIPLCTNQSIAAIYPSKNINSVYSFYYIDSIYEYLRKISDGGGGRGGLTKSLISKIYIPLPDLHEQNKIALSLNSIDNLLHSLDKLIAKKELIKQGAMQKLLTGKKRLLGFTEKWQGFSIGELGETYNGITGKSAKDFGHGKAKYITFLNVLANTRINTTLLEDVDINNNEKQNAVKCGDLFFNTSSETPEEVGMCSAITQDVDNTYLNSFCFGFRLYNMKTVSPLFLAYWFRTKHGRSLMSFLAQGSTRYNLSKDGFKKGVVSLPSFEEQNAIVEILTFMDDEIASLEAKREKYVSIKQGMMQQLLTGKIRLIS